MTFEDALTEFLQECEKRNRPATTRNYRRLLKSRFPFGQIQLAEIASRDILKRVDALGDTPSEQGHALVAIKVFMKWCVRREYLQSSPCDRLRSPAKLMSRDRILTNDELVKVFLQARAARFPFGRSYSFSFSLDSAEVKSARFVGN